MRVLPVRTAWAAPAAIGAVCLLSVAYVNANVQESTTTVSKVANAADRVVAADVTVRSARIDAGGRRLPGARPAMSFRLERKTGKFGVVAAMTLTAIERPVVQSAGGPRLIDRPHLAARMEHDASGLRLYNARGERLPDPVLDRALFGRASDRVLPPEVEPWRRTGASRAPEWLDGLVAAREDAGARRGRLERSHGPRQGAVRGLHQYISLENAELNEVLVDPATALPVEMNTVRNGQLVSRAQMFYASHPSGLVVRRLLRAERVDASNDASRTVLEIELSNLQTDGGVR